MSFKRTKFVSAVAFAALAVSFAPAFADEGREHEEHGSHGPMMMAQAGPGSGQAGPGMMKGRGGPEGDRAARHEERMKRFAERRVQLLDTDGDGKISVAEITAEQKRLFAAADVNGDGKLSADEFRRRGHWFVQLGTTSFFDMMDANGDQTLTVEEVTGPSERWFKRYDANKSGAIEADEYIQSRDRGHHGGRR